MADQTGIFFVRMRTWAHASAHAYLGGCVPGRMRRITWANFLCAHAYLGGCAGLKAALLEERARIEHGDRGGHACKQENVCNRF